MLFWKDIRLHIEYCTQACVSVFKHGNWSVILKFGGHTKKSDKNKSKRSQLQGEIIETRIIYLTSKKNRK